MYAIVKTGGKQYKVAEGDVIEVEKLAGAPGDSLSLAAVLLVDGDNLVTDAEKDDRAGDCRSPALCRR